MLRRVRYKGEGVKDSEFNKSVKAIKDNGDFWIDQGKEADFENMICDLIIDVRNSILLLAKVIQERPLK